LEIEVSNTELQRNWLVWFDQQWRLYFPRTRKLIAWVFLPKRLERYKHGLIYRLLGIRFVALVIPTGGLIWRRLFHWDGWSFGMGGASVRRAREYVYNTCVFECLHACALMLMLPDGLRAISTGCSDGILKFLIAGLLINGYPWMLQRYNRVRIFRVLERYRERRGVSQ
jgi:hypothetical protein